MVNFDFLTNSEMRQCLERDYAELQAALEAGAHKAVVVLSGSIVEAILVDYMLAYGPRKTGRQDPLKMELGNVIDCCHELGVLGERTRDLCSAVRSYRNLIHPGRVVRLHEGAVDSNSASIAALVVEVVARDVEKAFNLKRGLTCEQLISKIESDPNALAIMPHLVGHYHGRELERLVLEVIPARYQRVREGNLGDERRNELTRRYRACYEGALSNASKSLKKKAAQRVVAIIEEGTGEAVDICDDVFVTAESLDYLTGRQHETLRDHLLAKASQPTDFVLLALQGIGPHLTPAEAGQLFSPLARAIVGGGPSAVKTQQVMVGEYRQMDDKCQAAIIALTDMHIQFWKNRDKWERAERMKSLRRALDPAWVDPDEEDDIPF